MLTVDGHVLIIDNPQIYGCFFTNLKSYNRHFETIVTISPFYDYPVEFFMNLTMIKSVVYCGPYDVCFSNNLLK